jgi:hypothetical protein
MKFRPNNLIKVRKYVILSSLLIILTIPMFFRVFVEYLSIKEINWCVILIFVIGLLMLLFLSKILETFAYNKKNIGVIRKQDVMNALINRNNKLIVWLFFPMIIIIEELIFRYYVFGILVQLLELETFIAILLSSLVFSLFHIHVWFRYKNLEILLVNLVYPFLLGLYLGYLFLKLGIFPCIVIHFLIALSSYYNIYRKYFRKKD